MLIERLKLTNLLSFGPDSSALDLRPLNVLIGPNGSGKSNFIEAISLLSAAPTDITQPIDDGGGVGDWIWRGEPRARSAEIDVDLASSDADPALRYQLSFLDRGQRFQLASEKLQYGGADDDSPNGRGVCFTRPPRESAIRVEPDVREAELFTADNQRQPREQLDVQKSLLALVDNPLVFPQVCRVADAFKGIQIYRDWTFGPHAPTRHPQQPDLTSSVLLDDAANLGLVLNVLNQDTEAKQRLLNTLRELYDGISDLRVNIERDTVNVYLREGDMMISATRLSDGTIRYLCLLAILCHPEPPSLVCLEEPELGLHPDILPGLGELLLDASERCQLIVTTHSDILVDKLSDTPDSVVVCEKHAGQTEMRRLDSDDLKHWLTRYSLGELWTRGELGGNRW